MLRCSCVCFRTGTHVRHEILCMPNCTINTNWVTDYAKRSLSLGKIRREKKFEKTKKNVNILWQFTSGWKFETKKRQAAKIFRSDLIFFAKSIQLDIAWHLVCVYLEKWHAEQSSDFLPDTCANPERHTHTLLDAAGTVVTYYRSNATAWREHRKWLCNNFVALACIYAIRRQHSYIIRWFSNEFSNRNRLCSRNDFFSSSASSLSNCSVCVSCYCICVCSNVLPLLGIHKSANSWRLILLPKRAPSEKWANNNVGVPRLRFLVSESV